MAPGDYAGLQANRPRRLHSGTRSFSIAFFAEPEFLLLHLYTALLLPALFLAFARKNPLRIFALRGNRFVGAPSARNRRKERLDLPSPAQRGRRPNPAQGDMRMVLVAPFDTKRCLRLKKPVLEGERNHIPNRPPFCAKTESFLYAQKSFPHSRSLRRKNPESRSAPRTGGSIGPILLRPFSVAALRIPQRSTCGWFWVPFAIKRYRLKKPVLEGERNRIPNPPPFCAPIQKAAKLATGTVAILSKGPSFAKKVHSIIMSILTYTRATQMAHFLVLR